MWIEEKETKKGTVYCFIERYKCHVTGKTKKAKVTMKGNSASHKKRAYTLLMQKIAEIEQGSNNQDITLYQVVEEWQQHISPTLSERTRETHRTTINKIYSLFDDMPLSSLTSVHIESVLIDFHHVQKASYRYTSKILNIIKNALRYARRKGYIDDIEDYNYITIKQRARTRQEVEKAQCKFLDHDELKECFKQLHNINDRLALLVEFMTYTGLRIGELLALRECDYNQDTHTININGSIQCNTRTRGTPKNVYSFRDVPLNTRAVEIIEMFISRNRWQYNMIGNPQEGERYIFINSNGVPYESQYINKQLKKLNVNGKHISTHIFRHTHISLLSELGIPLRAIMQRVGHNDPRTTLSIYSHVTENMTDIVIEKLDTLAI